jgi:hypothetical protein
MNINDLIDTLNLETDVTQRLDCPFCFNNNTFSITKKRDGVVWYCFHASCGVKGGKDTNLTKSDIVDILYENDDDDDKSVPIFKIPEEWGPPNIVPNVYKILTRHNIQESWKNLQIDIRYDHTLDRIVFMIYLDGKCYGGIGRSYKSKPKWLFYKGYSKANKFPLIVPQYGTYLQPYHDISKPKVGVIVEDAISAAAISTYADGIAILGTHIPSLYLPILMKYDKLYIALDADATKKAIQHQKYLDQFVTTKLIMLTQDIKDMSKKDRSLLGSKINE